MVVADTKQSEYVFHQGDTGNSFFLVYKGEIQVEIDDQIIRTMGEGKSFG